MKRKLLNKSAILLAFLTTICSGCTAMRENTSHTGQTEETEESFLDVMEEMTYAPEFEIVYAETESYPELAAFLTDYYEIPEEHLTETRYYYNKIDINEDGKEEIMAATIGDDTSKASGDSVLILRQEQDTFDVLGKFTQVRTPVIISSGTTDGWRDIIFPVYGGGMDAGYIICHYTAGSGYQEEMGEFVEELEVTLTGTQILSNNLIDDMDKGTYLTLDE